MLPRTNLFFDFANPTWGDCNGESVGNEEGLEAVAEDVGFLDELEEVVWWHGEYSGVVEVGGEAVFLAFAVLAEKGLEGQGRELASGWCTSCGCRWLWLSSWEVREVGYLRCEAEI